MLAVASDRAACLFHFPRGQLFQLRKAVQTRLDFDKRHALQIRQWDDAFDQVLSLASM